MRDEALRAIKGVEAGFNARATVEEMLAVEKLMAIATKNMSEEELYEKMREFDKNMRKRSRQRAFNKFKERFSKKK